MSEGRFDDEWADAVVEQLHRKGVVFAQGLTDVEVDEAATAFGCPMPAELETLLRRAVPTGPRWARWTEGANKVAADAREWVDGAFRFDVEHSGYWHRCLGEQPDGVAESISQACSSVATTPPLFPIWGHRFLTSAPADGSRAVLPVWQAVDSILYGNDLADYLAREFGIERPAWAAPDPPPVPVWEDLFDLFGSAEAP